MSVNNSINSETAYTKVNLALHILAQRDDGYHDIDTIFAFLRDGDELTIQNSNILSLSVTGPFGDEIDGSIDDNLIMKTAKLLRDHCKTTKGAALHLHKNLPIASGIGGGSADAAAAARLLNRHWRLGLNIVQLAKLLIPLGADVPACVMSETCRGEGIGTKLHILTDQIALSGMPVLLINPMVSVSTGPIFDAWDKQSSGALQMDLGYLISEAGNDMQRSAISLFPQIQDVIDALGSKNPIMVRMSGSGATCFAIFECEADRDKAKCEIQKCHPNWWFLASEFK